MSFSDAIAEFNSLRVGALRAYSTYAAAILVSIGPLIEVTIS